VPAYADRQQQRGQNNGCVDDFVTHASVGSGITRVSHLAVQGSLDLPRPQCHVASPHAWIGECSNFFQLSSSQAEAELQKKLNESDQAASQTRFSAPSLEGRLAQTPYPPTPDRAHQPGARGHQPPCTTSSGFKLLHHWWAHRQNHVPEAQGLSLNRCSPQMLFQMTVKSITK
jgi:hypothetical protein